jgi:hypothetical protein
MHAWLLRFSHAQRLMPTVAQTLEHEAATGVAAARAVPVPPFRPGDVVHVKLVRRPFHAHAHAYALPHPFTRARPPAGAPTLAHAPTRSRARSFSHSAPAGCA